MWKKIILQTDNLFILHMGVGYGLFGRIQIKKSLNDNISLSLNWILFHKFFYVR